LNSLQYRLASAWSAPQGRRTARVNLLAQRLTHRVPDTGRAAERLAGAVRRLGQAQARLLVERRNRLAAASAQLRALDPGNTLARGYAIARDGQGRIVRDAAALSAGQPLDLSFAQGGAQVQVQSTRSTRDPS
jgi:exodeoxyribonuclease VII large subunit